jgi:hypothetical protein
MYFEVSEISYFGKWLWLTVPVIKRILNLKVLNKKIDTYGPNFLAFKFVMVSKLYCPNKRYTSRK